MTLRTSLPPAATEVLAVFKRGMATAAQPRHEQGAAVVGVMPVRRADRTALLTAATSANATSVDSVLEGLASVLTLGKPCAMLRLATTQRGLERRALAFVGTELTTPIRTRERRGTRTTEPCVSDEIRVFASLPSLHISESYDTIESPQVIDLVNVTPIIRTKHLRTGKLGLTSRQRLQGNSRLLGDHQRIGQAGFDISAFHAGNVGLALLEPGRELGLRVSRMVEVGGEIRIRPPGTSSHNVSDDMRF